MADQDRFAGLEAFLRARGNHLLREAVLLTGSQDSGEDLLQDALSRLMGQWHKVEDDPEGYLRRTLYNLTVDRWRYRARRREVLVAEPPEREARDIPDLRLRPQLADAMLKLSRRQRAVLVLRYFADATETETAAILDCSVGTVKSATHRGLARLRELTQNAGTEESSQSLLESLTD